MGATTVRTVRKSLLTAFMALTVLVGLITGFAHTNAAALPHASGIHASHVQLADWCPAPPKICSPVK
jgi:hypothetical protein